ncbi:hypothetical protein [Parafrankia discariae]|uniref:hypothetical protein n=1 Tax=Parafrankia discariae TaxID=365528 RepID=UPI00037E03A8|nr:hypothetical protein [Parafrankia discariae]
MSVEYGVWFDPDGAFVSAQCWSRTSAELQISAIVDQLPAADRAQARAEHRVRALCPDHRDDEQPADECELCDDENDESERP